MRLEMTDLLEENAANADDEEDSDDDEVDRLFVAEFAGGCDSDEDDENFVCDAVDGGGVSMKCDILRAVTQDATEAVAPIAPLPTRLSFCLPSAAMASAQVPVRALATVCNEAAICEDAELSNAAESIETIRRQSPLRKSPVKTVVGQVLAKAGEGPAIVDPIVAESQVIK
jgi:hypothetical protein